MVFFGSFFAVYLCDTQRTSKTTEKKKCFKVENLYIYLFIEDRNSQKFSLYIYLSLNTFVHIAMYYQNNESESSEY